MSTTLRRNSPIALLLLTALSACSDTPGDISRDSEPFDGIAASESISVLGTEPFWDVEITPADTGHVARYSTANAIGTAEFSVSRFAGNNGLGFSGEWQDRVFNLALTPGECSDGMSDRTYPYTATLLLGDVTLYGCAYTEREPFSEDMPS